MPTISPSRTARPGNYATSLLSNHTCVPKYKDLPPEDVAKIEAFATQLAKRHGITLAGPEGREDEQP